MPTKLLSTLHSTETTIVVDRLPRRGESIWVEGDTESPSERAIRAMLGMRPGDVGAATKLVG